MARREGVLGAIGRLSPHALAVWEFFSGPCATQWRHGFSGPTGLDYTGVEAAARLSEFELDATTFRLVRLLEGAYLKEREERRKAEEPEKGQAPGLRVSGIPLPVGVPASAIGREA